MLWRNRCGEERPIHFIMYTYKNLRSHNKFNNKNLGSEGKLRIFAKSQWLDVWSPRAERGHTGEEMEPSDTINSDSKGDRETVVRFP